MPTEATKPSAKPKTRLTRAESARVNGAKSRGPKTEEGRRKCREAAASRGLYAVQTVVLPTESPEAYEALRSMVFAFWSPRSGFETVRAEQIARLTWEARRIEMSRHDLLLQAMAEVRKHDPSIDSPETLNARTETRIASSDTYERQDRRLQRISIEISRHERDLIRMKKQSPHAEGSQMVLETKHHRPPGPAEVLPMPEREPRPATIAECPHIVSEMPLPSLPQAGAAPDILTWAKHNFQFEADEPQQRLLTDTTGRVLMCAGRQTGKSTAAALKVVYQAIHNPESLILVAGPSERQSLQVMEKARRFASRLSPLTRPSTGGEGFRLPNGSEVLALPGNCETIRGFSDPHLIVIDEAAYVSDELFAALLPAQAVSNGAVILLGTPSGQTGIFHEQWHNREVPWTRILVRSADCPRIDPSWLARMRLQLGNHQYRQEFECEFLPHAGQPISYELIMRAIRDDIDPFTDRDEPI